METGKTGWLAKHNWRHIARELPPKRAVAERICDFDEITSVPGIFAGGDLVRGPDLVVRAVRGSRKAAAAFTNFCRQN